MTQVQLPKVRRQVLGDQLEARLRALPGLPVMTVFRNEVVDPPLMSTGGAPDPAGRVGPYAVLFDGTGSTDLEPALEQCGEDLRWTPSITVASGFAEDCVDAVDRVYAWVKGWSPVLTGVAAGVLLPPPGFDPGVPRPDRQVTPIRFFVPLSWRLDLTT